MENMIEINECDYRVCEYTLEYIISKKNLHTQQFKKHSIWNNATKSKFIKSLILDYPIHDIILYENVDRLGILDGFNRINAIIEFMSNKLILKNIQIPSLNNVKYDNLPLSIQRLLNKRLIRCVILINSDIESRNDIFNRINT